MWKSIAGVTRIGLSLTLIASVGCGGSSNTQPGEKATNPPPTRPADPSVTNAVGFHVLDFVAWNNRDMDVFRRYHTADVKVDMAGQHTEGIDAHVNAIEGTLKSMPDARIAQHSPIVAEGEWTCMVGVIVPMNLKMVTVAKWRDGAIAEEYIFMNLVKQGAAPPTLSGVPIVNISNRRPELRREIGAEPGWSCVFGTGVDGKRAVVLTKSKDGATAEDLVFVE